MVLLLHCLPYVSDAIPHFSVPVPLDPNSPHIPFSSGCCTMAKLLVLFTGCKRDKDGYYWITGRIDDMLNVSGKTEFSAFMDEILLVT